MILVVLFQFGMFCDLPEDHAAILRDLERLEA